MKLAIDIGNTSTSIGLFDNHDVVKKIYFSSTNEFKSFLDTIRNYNIESAIISSVVPELTNEYKNLLIDIYQYTTFVINHKLSNLSLQVAQPETVGADRLCNIFVII